MIHAMNSSQKYACIENYIEYERMKINEIGKLLTTVSL